MGAITGWESGVISIIPAQQLVNFRTGMRGYDDKDQQGQLMAASALAISDQDVERIAEHYGR